MVVLVGATGMVGAAQLTLKRSHGYMHLVFYAILIMGALGIFFSGRNLNSDVDLMMPDAPARNALMALTQPLASLLMLVLAGERVIAHLMRRHKIGAMSPVLLFAFVLFWAGTVASPALWGAHPLFTHDYLYSLVIGVAAIWSSDVESDLAIKAVRDALLLLMVASLLLIPFKTSLVLDTSYTQGYLPGLPRFGGLTPHPVEMGSLAQLCLICLIVRPYHNSWLNRAAWALALMVFVLAQAKTSWLGFLLCSTCIVAIQSGPSFWRRVSDPLRPEFGVLWVSVFMAGVFALTLFLMFGHLDTKLSNFFSSPEGEQLSSLTGRKQIWAVAYDEWLRHPVFGYGPSIWDESFRTSIGMPFATHAH
ncbi:MAG: O-antigen ligase family protein, partial [Rhodoferax sp.]